MSEHSRYRPQRGMTLLELMVVILILSIVAGLFPLAVRRLMPARHMTAIARSLGIDIRELQSQAALCGRPLELILDSSGYTLQQISADRPKHVAWPANMTVTLKASPDAQPSRRLIMYPDGSSSGGEFDLHLGKRRATVNVTASIGRVRVSG